MDYNARLEEPENSISGQRVDGATGLEPVRDTLASHAGVISAPVVPRAKPLPPTFKKLLKLEAAKVALAEAAEAFKAHALAWIGGDVDPETYVIQATVGIGKTRAVNDILPDILAAMEDGKVVAIGEPTIKKVHELVAQLQASGIAESRRIMPLLGREAENPEGPIDPQTGRRQSMCRRAATVRAVAGFVDNVSSNMCRSTWTDANGEDHVKECPFFATCAHVKQGERARHAKILVVPHAALQTGQSELSDERKRLVTLIVDEDATSALIKHSDLPLENVWAIPDDVRSAWPCREPNPEASFPGQEPTEDAAAHIAALKTRYKANVKAFKGVVDATRADTARAELRPSLISAALAKVHGWEVGGKADLAKRVHDELSFMTAAERNKADLKGIDPTTPDAKVFEIIMLSRIHDRFKLVTLWNRLRDQVDAWAATEDARRDYCRSVMVDWKGTATMDNGNIVSAPAFRLHWSTEFKGGVGRVPTLILDADAERSLLSRWVKVDPRHWFEINAEYKNVIIRQAVDRTGSMSSIKKPATIAQIVGTANYLAAKYNANIKAGLSGRVDPATGDWIDTSPRAIAIFSSKATIEQIRLHHMVGSNAEAFTAALDAKVNPDFVTMGHYGELRGMNHWQHCSAAVLAGRIEPSIDKLEDAARAIRHLDSDILEYVATPEKGQRRLVMVVAWYRTRKGAVETTRSAHPDAFIDLVLCSIREADLRQALGRVRPVQRPGGYKLPPCEVYVLTSIPLGYDVIVDTLHEWEDLAADTIDRVWTAGFIPDHTGDLAKLADTNPNALGVHMHTRRSRRDIQAPAPGRRFACDRAKSAYDDVLGRPDDMDIGGRKKVRFDYYVIIDGVQEVRHATVLVAHDETRRQAYDRAIEIVVRLEGTAMIEGMDDEAEGFAESFEIDTENAWWFTLPPRPASPGKWAGAIPKTIH